MNDTRKEAYIQALSDIDCAQEHLKKTIACAINIFEQYKDMPYVDARATLASMCSALEDTQKELNSVVNLNRMKEARNDIQNNYNLVDVIKAVQVRFDEFAEAYQWVYLECKRNQVTETENMQDMRNALCLVGDLIGEDYTTWGISSEEEEE